jgi:hypothetical protein
MSKTWKILFLTVLILSLTFVATGQVKAQSQYAGITAEVLPSEGGANTTIILRFLTTNSSVGNVQPADIFWDNNTIALNQAGTVGADDSINYNITVPNESPLSDVGNHTIRVDSTVAPYGAISFFFTFNVTEFIPSPEFLALNDTYYSLLTNYTNILGNYTQLQTNFSDLETNYQTLGDNYTILLDDYNALVSDETTLTANYNYVLNTYGNLTNSYNSLSTNYASLLASFQTLNASYSTLSQDYSLLNSSYTGLLSNYNGLVGQLNFSRNLNYALIVIAIALALIATYYVYFKPKKPTKTR